mgnify:CR=1 FL=1
MDYVKFKGVIRMTQMVRNDLQNEVFNKEDIEL